VIHVAAKPTEQTRNRLKTEAAPELNDSEFQRGVATDDFYCFHDSHRSITGKTLEVLQNPLETHNRFQRFAYLSTRDKQSRLISY